MLHRNTWALAASFVFASAAPAQIFWTLSGSGADEIQRANLDGSNYVSLVSPTPGTSPWAMAASPANDRLYWTDIVSPFSVYRSTATGGSPTAIFNAPALAMSLAYHAGADQLYVGTGTQIIRVNGDGTSPTTIATGLSNVNGMAIDAVNGKVYWAEQGVNRIARSNLDGSSIETVVNTTYAGTTTERGVALDGNGGLYWTDSATDGVYFADIGSFTGTPVAAMQIVNLAALLGSGATPNGIGSDGTSLYWTEGASGFRGIYRSALDGTGAGLLLSTLPTTHSPIGISAVPEPTSLAFLPVGAAVVLWRRRRPR